MFQYIHESQPEKGNVTAEIANKQKTIQINCGNYSFAEMVSKFDKIFGVTGTLEPLSEFEDRILQKYHINLKSFAPSVYGESKKQINPILFESTQGGHFQTIATKIKEGIKNGYPVLVFFKN